MRFTSLIPAILIALLPAPFLTGCASTRYQVLNALGEDPKPLLKESMNALRDSLDAAAGASNSAYDRLRLMGQSKATIDAAIRESYGDACKALQSALKDIKTDARNTEENALATFNNWGKGLDEIKDPSLRAKSKANLDRARSAHTDLMAALVDGQAGLQNLSSTCADLGRFVDHNSAAQATAEVQRKLPSIATQVDGCKKLVDACQRKIRDLGQALDG
jgi:hypothetical protein